MESVDYFLLSENIWLQSYTNYHLYLQLVNKLDTVENSIRDGNSSHELLSSKETLKKQLKLFGETKSQFGGLLEPAQLETAQNVTNPFHIFASLSHITQNNQHLKEYAKRVDEVKLLLRNLKEKLELSTEWKTILGIEVGNLEDLKIQIDVFNKTLKELETTYEIYRKRTNEVNLEIKSKIVAHSKTLLTLFLILLGILAISFLLKLLTGKYFRDNQRVYMSNKAINFLTISIIVLILTFTYIDNIEYLITILGFASAGLAIAMKDGFMSMFAWFVIIFGGSVKVGDRIKVVVGKSEYVGDILDISLLRITLQEDVTLTTYDINRRAGRIIFVPNNYIFTNLLANYSHYTLRTVWDGIDIVITFDSNHKKATHIMKEIVKNYSAGYTDMTRKQLNKLRDRYNLRNSNVEPRMFSFIDQYGIKLSVWYLTNAYATLTLRSNISAKIIDAFNEEEDIKIAYPTQQINYRKEE